MFSMSELRLENSSRLLDTGVMTGFDPIEEQRPDFRTEVAGTKIAVKNVPGVDPYMTIGEVARVRRKNRFVEITPNSDVTFTDALRKAIRNALKEKFEIVTYLPQLITVGKRTPEEIL